MRQFWERKISCPMASRMAFPDALTNFHSLIEELFADFTNGHHGTLSFFPAEQRNLIMDAGQKQQLLELRYHGFTRLVEPYSLTFKRRQDGVAQEYFYAWDCTGGSSGPGIKTFFNYNIEALTLTDEKFEPRYEIEVSKAGELHGDTSFTRQGSVSARGHRRTVTRAARYTIQCSYCSRTFARETRRTTTMRPHKDRFGNQCHGRRGYFV